MARVAIVRVLLLNPTGNQPITSSIWMITSVGGRLGLSTLASREEMHAFTHTRKFASFNVVRFCVHAHLLGPSSVLPFCHARAMPHECRAWALLGDELVLKHSGKNSSG